MSAASPSRSSVMPRLAVEEVRCTTGQQAVRPRLQATDSACVDVCGS